MTTLSPAAQAIKAAMLATYDSRVRRDDALWRLEQPGAVSALRALADHHPSPITLGQPIDHWHPDERTRQELRNIAAELAGEPTDITTETTDD
jgi:uncharacterized protein YjiS (DUF1127 family)